MKNRQKPQCWHGGPAVVGLRVDRHRRRLRMQAERPRAAFQQHAGRFHRQRRHRIRPRARRIERSRLARDAELPFGLRVVRLELVVGDRPVGEAGAGHAAEPLASLKSLGRSRQKLPVKCALLPPTSRP